jgi:hypothetical protein
MLVLGLINLRPRPFLTNGARDNTALAIALSGFMVVGPMELFMPEAWAASIGFYIWLVLLTLYALVVILIVLVSRPRLVVYNITLDRLRPIVAELVKELDEDARWAGGTVSMPKLHVQLCIEAQASMRNIQLVPVGAVQSYSGWRRLEAKLAEALADVRVGPNPYGISFIAFALLMLGMSAFWIVAQRASVEQALRDMLRL